MRVPEFTVSSKVPQCLSLTPQDFLQTRQHIRHLLAGVLVFRIHDSQLETLLLRRAHSDSCPGKWERPAGTLDSEDTSLLACAVRELREETGLHASHIHCTVGMLPSTSPERGCDWGSEPQKEQAKSEDDITVVQWDSQTWGVLTLIVDVLEPLKDHAAIKIDPLEHDAWKWVTEDEVRNFKSRDHFDMDYMSEGVWRTILEGFRLMRGTSKLTPQEKTTA